jgi:DNA-directed RNA polymerase subunit RPC12/RpoP
MGASYFIPRPQIGEYPKCAKCSAQMWISRIEPDKPDHDKRTFECPACNGVTTAIVKYR